MKRWDRGDAAFSRCGRYRYRLRREWDGHQLLRRPLLFVMLNPSKADGRDDDATIRRCVGFARLWGYNAIEVVNLFALISTDPAELGRVDDPIGPDCDHWIETAALGALDYGRTVVAWGAGADGFRDRMLHVCNIFTTVGVELRAFDRELAGGAPPHPLRLPYALETVRWRPRLAYVAGTKKKG